MDVIFWSNPPRSSFIALLFHRHTPLLLMGYAFSTPQWMVSAPLWENALPVVIRYTCELATLPFSRLTFKIPS